MRAMTVIQLTNEEVKQFESDARFRRNVIMRAQVESEGWNTGTVFVTGPIEVIGHYGVVEDNGKRYIDFIPGDFLGSGEDE